MGIPIPGKDSLYYWDGALKVTGKNRLSFTWIHDDVMEWKCFPHYWPFVNGIHPSSAGTVVTTRSGPRFNIKVSSYKSRKSHCGDKTVVRSSYLHYGIFYTGKMSSLYWIRAQIFCVSLDINDSKCILTAQKTKLGIVDEISRDVVVLN